MHISQQLDCQEGLQGSRVPLLRTRALADQGTDSMDCSQHEDVDMPDKKHPTALRRVDWLQFVRKLHLELFLFVYAMSYSMRLVMTQDLFLTKACLFKYDINATSCRNLSWNKTIKDEVTRYANIHNLCLFLIQFVPAGLLSIFVSPWSDRYGHKIPLLIAIAGGILQDLATLGTVIAFETPMYVTVLCGIPNGFSGGLVSVCASVYSNGSRTVVAELKTVRFACILTALTLGFQLGMFIGGQIFSRGGYLPIYGTSAALLALMALWVVLTVPFSSQLYRTEKKELLRDLLRLDNLKEGGRAVFKPRPGLNRTKLLLMMVSLWFILFNSETARNINYYYTKSRFEWSPVKFSNVTALFGIMQMVATAVCVIVFSRLLQIRDPSLAIIGVVVFAVQNIIKGFATQEWMYYLSYIIGSPGGAAAVGISSYASKLISPHEATKVFSFWTTCESLVPAFGDIFSSLVFNAALEYQPGLPFLIGAILQLFPLVFLIYCLRTPEADPDDSEILIDPATKDMPDEQPHSL